jgi:transposase-like protein
MAAFKCPDCDSQFRIANAPPGHRPAIHAGMMILVRPAGPGRTATRTSVG